MIYIYKGWEIQKRNRHSRYGNWEVFLHGRYQAQFDTLKSAKAWCDNHETQSSSSTSTGR